MNGLHVRPPIDERDVDENPVDEILSDETLRRILVGIGVVFAAAVVVVLFVTAARWATADDSVEPYGNADIGFLQDMIDHHQQALLIANTYLDANPGGDAAPYAREVVLFQEREITRMDTWLTEAGMPRGQPGRQAMTWMGMPTPIEQVPGMQHPTRITELTGAAGPAADRLFFAIMSEHHLGGAHMADAAASGARRTEIREFAEKMSYNQRVEVVEYEQAVERLGL